MRRFLIPVLSTAVALVLTASSAATQVPRVPDLPAGWSHAEINVVINRKPHTLVYDRGTVQAVGPSSLTLKERDGSVQRIAVAANAKITIAGRRVALAQVGVRDTATTVAIDGGAAVSVKVQKAAPLPPKRHVPKHPRR